MSAIVAVRNHSGLGLAAAKKSIEDCLTDKMPVIVVADVEKAKKLIAELALAGFSAKLRYALSG